MSEKKHSPFIFEIENGGIVQKRRDGSIISSRSLVEPLQIVQFITALDEELWRARHAASGLEVKIDHAVGYINETLRALRKN